MRSRASARAILARGPIRATLEPDLRRRNPTQESLTPWSTRGDHRSGRVGANAAKAPGAQDANRDGWSKRRKESSHGTTG